MRDQFSSRHCDPHNLDDCLHYIQHCQRRGLPPETQWGQSFESLYLQNREFWSAESPDSYSRQLQLSQILELRLNPSFRLVELPKQPYLCGGQAHRIPSFQHLQTEIIFQFIPGGAFLKGPSPDDREIASWEESQQQQQISAFLLAKFPLSQWQWKSLNADYNPSYFLGPDNPIERISWEDVTTWCRLSSTDLRLPSEEEWEYACRAGTNSLYFWGSQMNGKYCRHRRNSKQGSQSIYARERFPNAFGLVDMLGQVWEWTDTVWAHYGRGLSNYTLRGGGWNSSARDCRSSSRIGAMSKTASIDYGARIAMTLPSFTES